MVKVKVAVCFQMLLFVQALWFCSGVALCEPGLSLEIAPQSGTVEDDFIFSVRIDGASASAYPLLSGGDDFSLRLIGPQSSVSVVNGKVTQNVTYQYALTPKKTGLLESPSAEVEIEGRKLTAAALRVQVSASDSQTSRAPGDVFLRQSATPSEVWLGEQLVRSLEIFTRVRVIEPRIEDDSYDGFWAETIEGERQYERVLGGQRYAVTQMRKALWALRPGEIELGVRRLEASIPDTRRGAGHGYGFGGLDPFNQSFFDNFFGTARLRRIKVASNAPVVRVNPLPAAPSAPAPDWNPGAVLVGKTELGVEYPAEPVKVGQNKTVEVRVSSSGNMNALKSVPLKSGRSFRVYEESPAVTRSEKGGLLYTEKLFRLSIVALRAGKLSIEVPELGYFDPLEGVYRRAGPSRIVFDVLPDERAPGASVSPGQAGASVVPQPEEKSDHSLKYKAPGLFKRALSGLSLEALGLVTLSMLALVWIVWLCVRLRSSGSDLRQSRRMILRAAGAGELRLAFCDALQARYPVLKEGALSSDLRSVMSQTLSPGRALEAAAILDSLDPALYGGATLSHQEFESLRQRCLQALR